MTDPKANASPTKAFFVRMLTRDISLDDCILDLIDNSIDSAWRDAGLRPSGFGSGNSLSQYKISIQFDSEHFKITDNCGGISLTDAVDYAFTFGRRARTTNDQSTNATPADNEDGNSEFTVGVYGIGMKRAVFKLGASIEVTSTHRGPDETDSFRIPIQVSEWLADETVPWDFDIEPSEALSESGVSIDIRKLNDEAHRRFIDPIYQDRLIQTLGRDYLLPLMQGLTIEVNSVPVPVRPISLLTGDSFAPMRETFVDDGVSIEIIAGMFAPPPDDNEPDTTREDKTSGWYIVCNGRVVLAADRSSSTGWGIDDFPRWHGQYSGFVGMVLFSAADPSKLPMTTTKRNVDSSSELYQRTVGRMLKPARAWIDYTNARKNALESAKKLEYSAKPTDASEVAQSSSVRLPVLRKSRVKVANVNYSVPLVRMRDLSSALGDDNLSYREVGLKAFDYTFDAYVDASE